MEALLAFVFVLLLLTWIGALYRRKVTKDTGR